MAIDKQLVERALAGAGMDPGALRHIAVCDGVAAVRVLAGGTDRARLDDQARAIHQVVSRAAAGAGETLGGLTVEFVDEGGKAAHSAAFKGRASPQQAGHRPISGLAQPGAGPMAPTIIAVGAGK